MWVDICSIMYNEEALLPLWIESWLSLPWINSIHLVDGGSTDKSFEIAKSYNKVKVVKVPWKNDFARQRNIAIKLARSDWIMQPDIDEIPCGNMEYDVGKFLNEKGVNEIKLPYLKFYNWDKLWFFNNGNTPNFHEYSVRFGYKSTITIFKKTHLSGYTKSLHEMPVVTGESKSLQFVHNALLVDAHKIFMVGHYDQAKHYYQAKLNNTSVEYEMGLKRARYRLISDASYDGVTYTKEWAERVLAVNDIKEIEKLGAAQLKSFQNEHIIYPNFNAFPLNNPIVKGIVK